MRPVGHQCSQYKLCPRCCSPFMQAIASRAILWVSTHVIRIVKAAAQPVTLRQGDLSGWPWHLLDIRHI